MLKKVIRAVVVISCLLTVNAHAHSSQQDLRNYIYSNFPITFNPNDLQIEQLAWAFRHNKHTNDSDLYAADQPMAIEVRRALTRLYCAQLLRAGTREAYQQFVVAQQSAKIEPTLSFAGFTKLAQHVQQLTPADYSLLETAEILSSVSLSQPAAELAARAMVEPPPSTDNMSFLAATLRNNINIYPITAQIMRDDSAARKLLYVLFPPQTNFRHMLYTEGGIGMFNYLRSMIKHGFIDKQSLDLWYAHWIVNIAAFRGHVDQRGSLYLNEPVAQAMLTLKDLIYEMLNTPNFDPLVPYLEYRAKHLGLAHLPTADRLFLAHWGSMLRLYTVPEGQELYASVMKIPVHKTRALKKYFATGLQDPNQATHLYVPAVFGNALKLTHGDLDQVLQQLLPIYDQILQQAARQRFTSSLSFNQLSASVNVQRLLKSTVEPRFKIQPEGTVLLG